MRTHVRIEGILLGTAVGDTLGLPMEGLSRNRLPKLFPILRQQLTPWGGMLSDDTEHTIMLAQSLAACPTSADAFGRKLAWKFRWWLLALPAGIGIGTLRAIVKLWLGFPPDRSGVYSAGNGPAMRSGVLGAVFKNDPGQLDAYVTQSTLMTHTDPKALTGARAVARLVAWGVTQNATDTPNLTHALHILAQCTTEEDTDWSALVQQITGALAENRSVAEFADQLGLARGVSGYMYHTVPVAVYAFLRHFGDFPTTLEAVIRLGGDTDTVGAITGALAGSVTGSEGIPTPWIDGIRDWPRSIDLIKKLAQRLSDPPTTWRPVGYFLPGVLLRNMVFLAIVLLIGFRRLAPPYD